MGKNLFLLIILFCIALFAVNCNTMNKKANNLSNVETFIDQNFKVDSNKISEEKSVRFNKKSQYNSSRIVYGFNDIDYFKKNKDNIFNFYGIKSDKLKEYFEEKYEDIKSKKSFSEKYTIKLTDEHKENMLKDETNEIGIGVDKENEVEKIYILVNSNIYSLKKEKSGNYIESIYKDDFNINQKDVEKYLGENNFKIINKNIEELRLLQHSTITETLKEIKGISDMLNLNADIVGIQNLFDRDLKINYKERPQKVHELHCFTRYDNNKFMGYNFDIYDKKLYVKDSKPFLVKLLGELGCNIENIDTWIKENGEFVLTYISFIKSNDNMNVTVYYNKPAN